LSRIRILPESLANQIAAGEVVERPASVVKELVENAIDAGAHCLTVEIEGAGTSLIRVIDDGAGMDRDDILLSLERHATSKLNRAEDLNAITTLGFRGEAIPSIASVARLTITSRTSEAELGSRVEVRFGKVQKVHEMGCGMGTVIEVRDLFGNVPARRKFLKTARTELAHIEEAIHNYALVRPALAISYRINGREVLGLTAGDDDPARRWRQLSGGAGLELVAVGPSPPNTASGISVRGVLVAPDQTTSGGRLRVFVNGRPVRDRLLLHAVGEGLHNFLLKGRAPAGVLFLELPPDEVDVNVHPTKQEVRFQRPQVVHQLIAAAVGGAMGDYQHGLKRVLFGAVDLLPPVAQAPALADRMAATPAPRYQSAPSYRQAHLSGVELAEPRPPAETGHLPEPAAPVPATATSPVEWEVPPPIGSLRIIGQLFNTYILCESDQGLVAIDQHAAQERLLFEKLKEQAARGRLSRQSLLFPVTVELSARELAVLDNSSAEIARMGLEVKEFGGATCLLQAVPALLGHLPPAELLRGVLEQLGAGSGVPGELRRLEDLLSLMACKAAIKARHRLTILEMEGLLREMRDRGVFSHCPHGRPTVRILAPEEIKKWFHRT
jgi:DNA mismatch repair protein MutL